MRTLLTVCTAALVLAASATAASGAHVAAGADLLSTPSLSDLTTEITGQLPYLQQTYCAYSAPKARSLSLKTSLANANSYLRQRSSSRARHKFAASSAAKSERGSLAAAAEATAASSPVAALDAVLRAHDLAPHDAMPLVDAAPILTNLKLPNEALALLAAANKMKASDHEPWGISAKALLANNRGYALLALKKWGAAETALGAAAKASPDLSEAEVNLALADICQGKAKPAAHMMFFGVRRSPQVVGDLVEGGTGAPTPTEAGIDVDHGVKATLPTYNFPKSMSEGASMWEGFQQLVQDDLHAETAVVTQQRDLENQLSAQLQNKNPATRRRTNDLVAVASDAIVDPTITPLDDARGALMAKLSEYSTTRLGQAPDCSSPNATHEAWSKLVRQYDASTRKELVAEYELTTAAAANIRNATAHQVAVLSADWEIDALLVLDMQQAGFLTMWDAQCVDHGSPTQIDPVKDPTDDRPDSARCPSGLAGKGYEINIGPVQLAVDCESVSAEIDTGGFIGAFGNVSHNFVNGSTTIFAGPRAKANPGPWGPNVTFKDGLYMTFDSSGQVRDMGARVETGSEILGGPAGGVTFSGDSMNFSIAGVANSVTTNFAH